MTRETLIEKAQAIEQCRGKIDDLWNEYFDRQRLLDRYELNWEKSAQEDPSLTNNSKREAYVESQRQNNEDYRRTTNEKHEIKSAINEVEAQIERLQNEIDIWTSESEALSE